MTLDEVRSHYSYDEWANARMTAALAQLDEQQLNAPLVSSFPTVLLTYAHIVAAEWIWLSRWKGTSPASFPDWAGNGTLAQLRSKLAEVEAERRSYLSGLEERHLGEPLGYRLLSGDAHTTRLLDLLLHVVNHSTYHRGQLTTMLRQVGATPPQTDLIFYRREQQKA